MDRPAPADIPEIYAEQPQPGFDPYGDLRVLRDIQPDMSGMDFIYPSGVDIGAIDIPDAVTLLSQADQNAMAALQPEARKVLDQEKAAQTYIDALSDYISKSDAVNKIALDNAKAKLVELDVPRSTIESATNSRFPEGIDTSQGISGVMGPTIGGAAGQAGQKILDLIGGGGQLFSDIITLGTGPEVAQTLLDPISILLGGLGGTINYSDSGPITPLILGKTTSGQPVGLNIPDPREIFEGGLGSLIPGAGTIITGAGALSYGDEEARDGSGVGITPAGVLTATMEGGVPDNIAGTGDVTRTSLLDADTSGATLNDLPTLSTSSDRATVLDTPTLSTSGDRATINDLPTLSTSGDRATVLDVPTLFIGGGDRATVLDVPTLSIGGDRTLTIPDFDPTETEKTPTLIIDETTTSDRSTTSDRAPGGGGVGLGETGVTPTGGVRGVSTEKAGVADIAILYDPSLSLAENMARMLGKKKSEQADAVDSALMYGGGIVQPTDLNEEILRILEGR